MSKVTDEITIKLGAHERASRKTLAIEKSMRRQAAVIERAETAMKHLPPDCIWQIEKLHSRAAVLQKQYNNIAAPMMRYHEEAQRILTRMAKVGGIQRVSENLRLRHLEMENISRVSDSHRLRLLEVESSQVARELAIQQIHFRSIATTFDLSHSALEIRRHLRSIEKMSTSFAGIVTDIMSRTITSPMPDVFIEKPPRLMQSALIGLHILDPEEEMSEEEKDFLVESTGQVESCRAELKKLGPGFLDRYDAAIAASDSRSIEAGAQASVSFRRLINDLVDSSIDKHKFRAWNKKEKKIRRNRCTVTQMKLEYVFQEWETTEIAVFTGANNSALSTQCFLLNEFIHLTEEPISNDQLCSVRAWATETILFLVKIALLRRNN